MCQRTSLKPTFLSEKSRQKNFAPNTPIYFCEAFEVPRNFSRKVSCVGVPRRKPQHLTHTKNAVYTAFLFCHNVLELRSKPCFKRLFQKPLKNPHTPFFRRKVCQRTLHRTHHFIFVKLLKFQETFPEKFLWSESHGGNPN